ncbi:class I SAM-dependent methyltransferase [Streptomyces oceani]|uniref:Methyltransferase type 11 domain-containing protein n=1 Tax=Streptomyces oceani TaxID=1075402 RepID=A0A1E7KHR9_9ACTN|nr:class I SAM-dependent methyltransferase [Streptomyces oceani]OEV03443.1 hypothetical protein AN216_11280 [Streptomyces oceani]
MTDDTSAPHWEQVAEEWTTWARTPGHDVFWDFRTAFRDFLPAPGDHTLELGCGEGRISRELTDLGHRVTASDLSPSLLHAAERSDSAAEYHLADATALPFPDGGFDRVVAYNMLMDVPDMPAAVREAARVLSPSGVLTLSVVHPFFDRGRFTTQSPDADLVISGELDYHASREFRGTETRDGLTMRFHGWSHSLGTYTDALYRAGFTITELREPRPAADPETAPGRRTRWQRLPLFLWINARKGA